MEALGYFVLIFHYCPRGSASKAEKGWLHCYGREASKTLVSNASGQSGSWLEGLGHVSVSWPYLYGTLNSLAERWDNKYIDEVEIRALCVHFKSKINIYVDCPFVVGHIGRGEGFDFSTPHWLINWNWAPLHYIHTNTHNVINPWNEKKVDTLLLFLFFLP